MMCRPHPYRRDEPAAHVTDLPLNRCAGVEEMLQCAVDIGHMQISGRAGLVAVRVEADFLISDVELHVGRIVHRGLHTQQLAENRLRLHHVPYRIDHGLDVRRHWGRLRSMVSRSGPLPDTRMTEGESGM